MLKKKNSLPGAQTHAAIDNGDHFACAGEGHADVAGHVVGTFVGMDEPGSIFGNQAFEKFLQITAGTGIRVLHDDETGTRVLHHDSDCSVSNFGIADDGIDLCGDFSGALATTAYGKGIRVSGHIKGFLVIGVDCVCLVFDESEV